MLYKKQEALFAKYADNAFAWKYLERPAYDKHLQPLLRKSTKILDAGCGSGRILNYLVTKGVDQSNITAVDENKKLLNIAKKRFPKINFIKSNLTDVKIKNNTFDVITCMAVLQDNSLEKTNKIINKFYQWLRVGGIVAVIAPHPIRVVKRNLGTYFQRKKILTASPWGTKFPHYHRTISDYITPFIANSFTITAVDEPELSPETKTIDSKEYANFTSSPSRLVIIAMKKQ